ncbi:MAG TPA: hypothetical protein VHB30_11630 [Solirubrobacteraceae bacterium]|nr:hypothetical protein [Solirubrobacteraceae bacterium]
MSKSVFHWGGVIASVILVAMGAGSIVIGASGHHEVGIDLNRERITGTPDMTPSAIRAAIKEAGLKNVEGVPTCTVADKPVNTGDRAKCFAQYMRIHALEATGGRVYAEMGQYLTPAGKETNDKAAAAKDPKTGAPVANGARNVWVTETALTTALNTSFFAQQVALFSMIVGIALLLAGIGFLVLTLGLVRPGKPPVPHLGHEHGAGPPTPAA